MSTLIPFLLSRYVSDITAMITEKYGMESETALRKFLFSETYRMLRTPALEMWDFAPAVIFELWECEQITGDPRKSVYIRGEA